MAKTLKTYIKHTAKYKITYASNAFKAEYEKLNYLSPNCGHEYMVAEHMSNRLIV